MFGVPATDRAKAAASLPDDGLFKKDPEGYWKRMRTEQFYLPDWRVFLNNGSLGVAPRPVLKAVEEYLERGAGYVGEEYPRWGYETMDEHRQELSDFFGCKKDELALMHNATAALCTVANGLDLKAGDEVLLTDQEHPSGRGCWYMKQARYGVSVREVPIPKTPTGPQELADRLISAIGPKTKVLSFSGIISGIGLIMPVREICDAARAKGVLTLVDGAHMHGQIPVNISDLHCDFMAGSPHKWVFAPPGCGLLYIKEEHLERLWPSVVSGGWDDKKLKAARFMNIGTNNRAIMEGMIAGLRFFRQVGPERIYARTHQLARMAFAKAKASPYVDLITADDDRLFGALVCIRMKSKDRLDKLAQLQKQRKIWTSGLEQVRISTHIHTRPSDLDLYFETIREAHA